MGLHGFVTEEYGYGQAATFSEAMNESLEEVQKEIAAGESEVMIALLLLSFVYPARFSSVCVS